MIPLTTGTLSGLGKHIYENLGGIGLTRYLSTEDRERIKSRGADTIIHCAFNSEAFEAEFIAESAGASLNACFLADTSDFLEESSVSIAL